MLLSKLCALGALILVTGCSQSHSVTRTDTQTASPAQPSVASFQGTPAESVEPPTIAAPTPRTSAEPTFADTHLPADLVVHSDHPIPESALLYFSFDRWDLHEANRRFLEDLSDQIGEAPIDILIEGHADLRGTHAYNFVLGHRRAEAVKAYLVDLGLDPARVITKSYGELRPTCLLDDEYRCHRYNRRTFLLLQAPRHARLGYPQRTSRLPEAAQQR
ncbi:MAG: OmpA family protein [Nitrospirae bacterium]|nr:MAG: OmpA family protein [Nitrospirota bacterium]